MRLFILLILFFEFAAANALRAQSISYVHYDEKDGLPSSTVYDITQDNDGFIWFGTENGLCRFDGKNFKTFTTKNGLPDNSILKVLSDRSGRLYFSPFTHGLYYCQNDSFYKFPIPDKYKMDLANIVFIEQSKEKIIVMGGQETYIVENDQLLSIHDKYKRLPSRLCIHRIYDTLLVVGTFDTLSVASLPDSLYFISESGRVRAMKLDTVGNFIMDSAAQLHKFHIANYDDFRGFGYLQHNLFFWMKNNILRLINATTGKILYELNGEKFSKMFIDNENNLWLATLGNGIYRFPSFGFRSINFDGKTEIFSIAKFKDQLLAGTEYSKLFTIKPRGSQIGLDTTDLSKYTAGSENPYAHLMNRNRLYVLRVDGDDLYIGGDAFLVKLAGRKTFVSAKILPVKDIDIDEKNVLVCTGTKVLLMEKQRMSITDTLLKQRSTCGVIYHGNYYIGTIGGLIRIDAATKKITQLYNLFSPFKARITAIKRGIGDDLWIATSGSGLVHFRDDRILHVLKEEDGLTSDICTSIYVDSTLIWLGTNNGLNRIETGTDHPNITRFTSANGLSADFINAVIATDSTVCVGTAAGLTIFNKNILTEKSVCILHVLQVSENNNKLKSDSVYTFPHNALNIQVDFSAISFKSAGDITYYYQLKGLDNQWNSTRANFVNFPTLQPNNYTLLLKAVNKFGVESDTIAIKISITPPWWQTWVFRIGALLAIVLIVFFVYRYNIRSIKKREATKREIEAKFAALEQKALQAQMNPHFIFNCLNSIQTFILNFDAEGANNYLTTFASLIRQTLDNSMHPLIPVSSEIKYLQTYLELEKLRFREKFRYQIHIDETIDENNTVLPGMLLQPYVENSLRHGIQHRKDNNGLISLSVSKTSNHCILYTITDNGVGRKKAQELKSIRHIEYQSRGISINEKRVAAINNQFNTDIRIQTEDTLDERGIVTGTRVSVWVPPFANNNA